MGNSREPRKMPEICSAIKANGVKCSSKAKEDGRCGTHKNSDVLKSKIHLRHRAFYIYSLDVMNRIPPEMKQLSGWVPISTEEGLEYISIIEALIRQDYNWTSTFDVSNNTNIRNSLIITDRRRAELKVPLRIQHQIPLMHGWYQHVHRVLAGNERRTRIVMTLDQLYNETFVVTTLTPWFQANWVALDHVQKREMRRAFPNMRILNQLHISNLEFAIPADAAPMLNGFHTDSQNVHRKDTVSYIEKAFNILKKIAIPEDQRTLGEILVNCRMKPEAEVQMVRFYHSGESIYEHKSAYKRALDGVWALIRKHENKKELYIRVADEMNDNIGMCAQGNLSRICNILCGYLEEFKPPVPQGTLVQNAIAAIAMDSEGNKIGRAKAALKELVVPESEWSVWLDAIDE